ncbi:MAG TPA: VOC family protein [Pseudonocardia sp.]|nr:VOC family protein [Pseudonocardia sp.]
MGESRHPAGSVCWLDLGIADVDAAVAFYGELLGWTVAPPDGTGYRLAGLPGGLVAAFGPAEDPGAPYWTVYVGTADIEASVRAYAAAGGTVVAPPEAVGDVGASAVVRDPAGVPMSFWQPGTHLGTYAAGSGEPGTLAGVRLLAADPARTGAFLAAALGWHLQPDGTITHADTPVATWSPPPSEDPAAPHNWLVEFAVADVTAATARALDLGAQPTDLGARLADAGGPTLVDPSGARFALTQAP